MPNPNISLMCDVLIARKDGAIFLYFVENKYIVATIITIIGKADKTNAKVNKEGSMYSRQRNMATNDNN